MPSARLREFDRCLRDDILVALADHGFAFGGERTFRRRVEHEGTQSTQIIEFQVGLKYLAGRFTVNLGVFNPEYSPEPQLAPAAEPHSWDCISDLVQRLGFFRTRRRSLVDRLLGRGFEVCDYWWYQSHNPRVMRAELGEVRDILLTHGLLWLNTRTSLAAFQWALRQLERRKERNAALGSPNAQQLFAPEPFPEAT